MTLEEDLVNRYKALLAAGKMNPYNRSKAEWVREITEKIKQLEGIIADRQKTDIHGSNNLLQICLTKPA